MVKVRNDMQVEERREDKYMLQILLLSDGAQTFLRWLCSQDSH